MAFTVTLPARLSLFPIQGAITRRQDSLDATDRLVAPPQGAFDTALRYPAFPPGTGRLLPGSLAITRTGLSPVGHHQLV